MSIVVDAEKCELRIEETLSFEHHVLPYYEDLVEDVKYALENDEIEEREEAERFVNYNLTNKDKVEILEEIRDDYEYESEFDDTVTLFDDDGIIRAINKWREENFDFEWDD